MTEGTVGSIQPTVGLRRIGVALIVLIALAGCAGVWSSAASARTIPEGSSLWFACTESNFSGPKPLDCPQPYNPQYLSTFLGGFQRFTPENEFQQVYTEPREDDFNFTTADQVAQFALAHHLTIRGHALLWWGEEPNWLSHPLVPWTYSELEAVMHDYITTVVSHFATAYPGVVTEWDVVNEPVSAGGNLLPDVWEKVLGPDYIDTALEAARAADPNADLVINDEGSGAPGAESTAMLNLATQLKDDGEPLDTIGIEAHVTPATAATLQQLVTLFSQYNQIGVKVEITELDVNDQNGVDDPAAKQAVFETYAQACEMAPNCTGYTVWGVADKYSWLGADTDALLYGMSFQPSPAVSVVQRYLAGTLAPAANPKKTAKTQAKATTTKVKKTTKKVKKAKAKTSKTKKSRARAKQPRAKKPTSAS